MEDIEMVGYKMPKYVLLKNVEGSIFWTHSKTKIEKGSRVLFTGDSPEEMEAAWRNHIDAELKSKYGFK